MSAASWDASAEDFGQKVDLTVRIREILRNYPEGLSILKELIQNADDAGARTIRFCAAEERYDSGNATTNSSNSAGALSNLMKGPSLLAYNSAKFSEVDFKSIQQIGDSLKKDAKGTKTGRFGVGVNSTYHLTDVPMFVSGSKVVMFDPQASFVPGINPANPGKMVDCSKENGRKLVQSLPQVFDPLKVFGCKLEGEDFNGTTFRFALRTKEQANVSRLSRQSHPIEKMRELLNQMASVAPTMLLFLKNVECIEIYDWKSGNECPTMIHSTSLSNKTNNVRMRRSYVLNAPSRVPDKAIAVDYMLEIQSTGIGVIENGGKAHTSEKWMVCNQLGGGNASVMASNPELSHMKLVPWAGVAARLSPPSDVSSGNAYCFLPLPVQTQLPIHVNGYFELSSNRRDVWSGSDMAGDGKARAEWNESIVQAIAAPSYVRLISAATTTNSVTKETYELLFPQRPLSGPWELLCREFMKGIRNLPVLYSDCAEPNKWVAPSRCLLPHDDDDSKLLEILALDRLPLVQIEKKELKEALLKYGTCTTTATPSTIRRYFSRREPKQNGSLELTERKIEFAAYVLSYCLSDLDPTQYNQLTGCQFIPLANGDLGKFCSLPEFDHSSLLLLQSMGFSKLSCTHSLRVNKGDVDSAMEWLLKYRYEDEAVTVQVGVDPFLICGADSASLLMANAADTFVQLDDIENPSLKKFFSSGAASSQLNILPLQPDMLADVVARSVPRSWRGNESAEWNPDISWPNVKWFIDLWRFICSCNDIGESLKTIAEQYCIVPTQQGIVCALSPGASVIDSNGLDPSIIQVLVSLGVRTFYADVFPKDLVIPKAIWSYVFQPTVDGVIKVIDTALRRESTSQNGANQLQQADNEVRMQLFRYFAEKGRGDISTPCKVMLRNFPIFRTYCNGNTTETKFVSMVKPGNWYVLEHPTDEDSALMTSDFLVSSNRIEFDFVSLLGAKTMSKIDFFKRVLVPQLDSVNEDLRNKLVGKILLDLPSLATDNPGFSKVVSQTKCIPSAGTKTLKSPLELYDPGVPQLVALMDHDSFPGEYFMKPDLLLSLRKLGLQSTLTWDIVLDCARSIELEGTQNDRESAILAKTRGSELLLFLDMNKESYFPEIKKKSTQSRTSLLFRKVNAALFEESDEKKKDKQIQAQRVSELLSIKWIPVYTEPPNPFLPWPEFSEPVAAPLDTITSEKMWLASYAKRLVDGDVHSVELKKIFGWLDEVSIKDVSLQLRMLGKTFEKLRRSAEEKKIRATDQEGNDRISQMEKESMTINALCQKVSSEVGRIYHILNNVESEYEMDVMKSILHGSNWLWMGNIFVSSDHVAFTSSINATPYLFTVPPDLACFKNLLTQFNVRNIFGSSDYCLVLNRMAEEQKSIDIKAKWSDEKIELAVNLVQKISDDVLRLRDFEIFTPTTTGEMILASKLVYDDAPWLSKDLGGKKELTYAHTKLSASVCDKIGVKSVRKILLQSSTDMIKFGDSVVHEAFGQSESLTRRLKNIVEMYPEGPQQLSELIQNADDAKATVVKFIISKKQHGRSSLLGQKMTEWQGGGLYCFNDATFTARDFQNLSKIGQASKLQKLVTTGRFGLGFNSVFHWTDVPSLVSGDYLVMFDPHAKYVPGATDVARGIKIRFSNSELVEQFPHQMTPYLKFGCDMKNRFNGTLFRFPFRNTTTAAESEISKKQYGEEAAIQELLTNFKKVVSKLVLFLRHVKRVEVHLEEDNDDGPKLLYYAEVASRKVVEVASQLQQKQAQASGLEGIRNMAANRFGMVQQPNDWNAIANFISGSDTQMSKEAFYSKLLRTPENQLPQTKHLVTINFVDIPILHDDSQNEVTEIIIADKYLICSALGAGKCRAMACKPEHADLKFLPWAGIAAHLSRNGKRPPPLRGNAFCFLPLPAETGFSVHLNGYFELSANRRDIWFGEDMSGAGKVRSEWNTLLLSDVISPLYTQVLLTARSLLGPGKEYDRLWPVSVSSDIWKIVRSRVYSLANNLPLVYTSLGSGKWCSLVSAVFLNSPEYDEKEGSNDAQIIAKKTLMTILLQEEISVVSMSPAVISCMSDEKCGIIKVSPSMVREWFRRPSNHLSLHDRENVVFLLRYCIDDLVENRQFNKLRGLPLLPLLNGLNGTVGQPKSKDCYFVPTEVEQKLLLHASFSLIDASTSDSRLNNQLKSEDFHALTNVSLLDMPNFVKLLSHAYPPEWDGLPEIRWNPNPASKDASPENATWMSKLWDYVVSDKDNSDRNLSQFENGLQIVPTVVGEGEKTLQMLTKDMAIVNISESDDEEISKILWSIGIRTLDTSIFIDTGRICRTLKAYVQPSTVRGIIKALTNSVPGFDVEERNQRMAARFQYLSKTEKVKFRKFLRDSDDIELDKEEIVTLRSLPIFEVFALGKKEELSHLVAESFLPPSCAERDHLDGRFVKVTSRKEVTFLEVLGLKTMSPVDYYVSYLCDSLAQNLIQKENCTSAVTKMLQDIPILMEEDDGKNLVHDISSIAFVPNSRNQMVKPKDLYDPHEPGLLDLVDDSMLPAKELRHGGVLQTLRLMGMRTKLSSDGIIESARRIEYEAKNLSIQENMDELKILAVRKRAKALLNFLDDDETVITFLSDFGEQKPAAADSSETGEIELTFIEESSDLVDELNTISWLPVERTSIDNETNEPRPPRRQHQLSGIGICSPSATRPKPDEWICSKSLDILSLTLKSESLMKVFKWDVPPRIPTVASQIVALEQLSNEFNRSQSLRQHLPTVTSQIYEILDSQIASASIEEKDKLTQLFQDNPWIWVGDRFVTTNQVAFNAPDNAKPFLYTVPNAMECFTSLLNLCGVRESFSGEDFVQLLSSLSNQLRGNPCDSRQLDLAIFVSRYLSRVPHEELDLLDKSQIFLPSTDNIMHRASLMTFDDAPWLSAIVKRTRHVFVHPDVGNEVARVLGSNSLRDVLSANQNGMVKVPCPKYDALHQILKKRTFNEKEVGRVILELMELAEMRSAKQVSITVDRRSHGTMSLLHPCLAPAQGPALVVCFHDVPMEVDEMVKLTSPVNYYSSSTSGNGGCGGNGYPRYGRGLCGSFSVTDCLQILSGRSLVIFDPSGEYFIEDQSMEERKPPSNDNNDESTQRLRNAKRKKKEKGCARNYGISNSFCKQFPDQFEPFLSLPYGVSESMVNGNASNGGAFYRGTIIRIPFRSEGGPSSKICDKTYNEQELEAIVHELKQVLPQSLLFTYHLQSVSFDKWEPNESDLQNYFSCRVSSSPLSRRSHLEEMWDNNSWKKDKSKIGKLFKSSWSPLKASHTMQISSKLLDKDGEIIDTYIISSILAPPKLREMACTDSLAPLKLLPLVSIAAHIHRNPATPELNTMEYKPAAGCIFVGLPTGIETGLPFHINAPLFLHEWTGNVMLERDDDNEFKLAFPNIRNVNITDKHNTVKTRSLALYVWNRQALLSAMTKLIPPMMKEIRNSIHHFMRDQRLFYRFWPFYERIHPRVRDIMDKETNVQFFNELAGADMDIYLTEKDGFKPISQGRFASPEYKLNDAADFFLQRMALFTTPKLVVEDLNRFGVDGRQLTPSVARTLLKAGRHVRELTGRPREVLAILEYCLADLVDEIEFGTASSAARIFRQELMGLYILPLSDGTIGRVGSQVIIASTEQQSMLPAAKSKFLWPRAMKFLEQFLSKPGFMDMCSFQNFGPKILSQYISTALPQSWEGKDFVKWEKDNPDNNMNIPTELWIYQFWREVPIWDHDAVQLFRRWPLIPTKSGELASCGNARYILYICTAAIDDTLCSLLAAKLTALSISNEKEDKRDLIVLSTERRLQSNSIGTTQTDSDYEEFWDMGKVDEEIISKDETSSEDESMVPMNAEESDDVETSEVDTIIDNDSPEEFHDVSQSATDEASHEPSAENLPTNNALTYDPSTSTFQDLFGILTKIECPLLEASFFTNEELIKILPADRLGVTRAIMKTLNQCTDYWTSNDLRDQSRLRWCELNPHQFDEFLLHLSSHQGTRLSLMVSDLTTMKDLPLFETFSGTHISISDRDQNFTLDNSVDIDSIRSYLPLSLQRKLLLDKPQFKDLYEDLNIRVLDEASILKQFVLKEFPSMPITQKEVVIKNILEKWTILSQSDGFIDVLKETAFVKRKENNGNGQIVFVKPNQLFDPRNELLNFVFDQDRSSFPAEEFETEASLDILKTLGLRTTVDKDTFLKCAWIVEGEQSVPKAMKLFEYFNEHFGEFFDNNRGEFIRNLAEVCCVPAAEGQSLSLCRFRDAAAPKDKHLVFKVMPIIHSSATPPQVMFSSLGIVSPPAISVVLRQLRALTEDEGVLDHWNYKHGTVETVFSEIFSFLQDNYDDISPRVQEGLREQPIVPVGTTLVKANRLFFRLAKDLSPFFYEVPRAFGAYDVLLRHFGVRESPKSGDYALSLLELNREIGASRLNANELKSVIEVVSLVASNDQNITEEAICAPDVDGKLVSVNNLLQNDQPWLLRKLDLNKIHLCHPKLSKELLNKLQIRHMSEQVHEVLDDQSVLKRVPDSGEALKSMENKLHSNEFTSTLLSLVPKKSQQDLADGIKKLTVVKVETIQTRFVLVLSDRRSAIDVTNQHNNSSSLCFINKGRILVSQLPLGVSNELVIATALCDNYSIPREHVGGIAVLLSSPLSHISEIKLRMGLYGDEFHDELLRGDPGQPLVPTDKELATVKPLKVFKQGEIVAVCSPSDSNALIYGTVTGFQDGASLSRLSVTIGNGMERTYLTSEVYSLGRSKSDESNTSTPMEEIDISCLEGDLISKGEDNDYEAALVNNIDRSNMRPVSRTEVLTAVQDLLQSADLSLSHNAKSMLDSNLSLQEALTQKDKEIELIEKKTNEIARKAMGGVDAFLCPITREPMEDPVICCDGHTYERTAIATWLGNNSRSPKTNQPLPSKELIPNHALRSSIEAMGTLRETIISVSPHLEEGEWS